MALLLFNSVKTLDFVNGMTEHFPSVFVAEPG